LIVSKMDSRPVLSISFETCFAPVIRTCRWRTGYPLPDFWRASSISLLNQRNSSWDLLWDEHFLQYCYHPNSGRHIRVDISNPKFISWSSEICSSQVFCGNLGFLDNFYYSGRSISK
jgi:hypothetical protein